MKGFKLQEKHMRAITCRIMILVAAMVVRRADVPAGIVTGIAALIHLSPAGCGATRTDAKAFHAVNGYALRCMARHLNHRSQRRYRLKFADTYYGELNHYGMYWLRWADVRRRRY